MPTFADPAKNKEYLRQWHLKNRARRLEARKKRYQLNRERELALCAKWGKEHRHLQRGYQKKHRSTEEYKEYNRIRGAEWRLKNRERSNELARLSAARRRDVIRIRNRASYQKNPNLWKLHAAKRRALKRKATVNLASILTWQNRIKKQRQFRCYWCMALKPIALLHFDHIVPLVKGGPHSVENLCCSCQQCNLSKNKRLVSEWYRAGQLVLGI